MNALFQRHELRWRHALAVVAGLLLAAAFPKPGVAGLAWVAPGLLLFSAAGQPAKVAFRLGWLGGLAFNLAALHWLLFIPVTGFPILGWLALSAYAAVYPGLWVWLCWRLAPVPATSSRRPDCTNTEEAVGYSQRAAWALKCAVLWVGLETILGCILTGFPWLALGVSQHKLVPLIQIASVTSVAGVSFLVVWFAATLPGAGISLVQHPTARWLAMREVALPAAAITLAIGWGLAQPRLPQHLDQQSRSGELRLALIQPSIPQTMIWKPAEKTSRFAKLMQLSELALATKPDVLVWPEAALPELNEESFRAITNLVARHQVFMVFGADDYELKPGAPPGSNRPSDYAFYNSALLLSPEGKILATYRKRHLVMFGEYIPLADWLPFLKWFTPIEGGFATGREPVAFALAARRKGDTPALQSTPPNLAPVPLRAGILICFEDAVADVARASAADADFLLNLTNDGWFGESWQQFQHAAHSVFRAVENRRPVVRCTNNGLTCWVDERGFMHDLGVGDAADVYSTGFRVVKLPRTAACEPTFYQRHANWFGWTCAGLSAALLIVQRRRARA